MSRSAIPTWFFVLAVVRRGDAFLLVEERKRGGGWYVPACRVEPGESLRAVAGGAPVWPLSALTVEGAPWSRA